MKTILSTLVKWSACLVMGTLITVSAHAQNYSIGSMPIGSGWYVAAAALKNVIEAEVDGSSIEIIARGGGVANPMVVQNGRADIALSNVTTSLWASKGRLLYEGQEAPDIRSLVGGLNPVYIGAIVRNNYLEEHGFSSLKDILESDVAVNIMMKPPGSNIPPAVDLILEAHGMTRPDIEDRGGRIIQIDSSQMSSMMRDGRADLYFDTILRGHPTIQEISLTADVRFMDLSEEASALLSENGLQIGEIPQWFDAQTEPTLGADFGTHLITHKNMPDDMAYRITKAVVERMDTLAKEYPAWNAFVRENAAKAETNGVPLHPGAERYYKEIGLL